MNQQNINFNKNYKIYRFVDDYYIFSSTYETLETIEQEIARELSNFNLKLNFEKHQIKQQPFSLADTSIIQLKNLINNFNNHREINLLKLQKKSDTIEKYRQLLNTDSDKYKISKAKILIKESAWIHLYDAIRNIISNAPDSKRRIVLYFLKTISLEIYEPIFLINPEITNPGKNFLEYLRTINTALDQITNIYSIHPDSDTTNSYISTLIQFRSSISKLISTINNNNEHFIKNSTNYLLDIENRIFENIYRVLKNNANELNNISDLIVYLKFLDNKLSTQFLCRLLDKNLNDYYTLCAIGYYIMGHRTRYRVVINYLFKLTSNFIKNYQTHSSSLLEDAKYFYILNDFLYYPEFQELKIGEQVARDILQDSKNKELDRLGQANSPYRLIFNELMMYPYYNWNLKEKDFKKRQIQKIIIDNENHSFNDY